MARGDITVFNTSKEWLMDGTFDLDGNTINLAIADNTVAPTASTATPVLGDFTEVTAAGTYTTGGVALTCTWVESGGTVTFDTSTSPSFAANASNDVDAYWGIIYAVGTLNGQVNPAICFLDLGGPVDMTAGALDISFPSGIFTLA